MKPNKKPKIDAEKIKSNLKEKHGEGFFISNINGLGCYFYYNLSNAHYDIIFTSNDLKAQDLRFLFERNGRKVTEATNNKEYNMIFKPFSCYLEPNMIYQPDTDSGVYRVEEHQMDHVFNQAKILERVGKINNFKKSKAQRILNNKTRKTKSPRNN